MPKLNIWIKDPDAKEFVLNNPLDEEKLSDDYSKKQAMKKLTSELNQKFNRTIEK